MQKSVMALTKERGELDMKRMHTENELRQCLHAKQTLEMDKDILQKDVASLQKQLDDKSDALRQSWSDANFKVILNSNSDAQLVAVHQTQCKSCHDRPVCFRHHTHTSHASNSC